MASRMIAVCGGRDFDDVELLNDVLEQEVLENYIIVTGVARGADTIARQWAYDNGRQVIDVPAMWAQFGKRAGFIRNAVIASLPLDLLIAFPGGNGTKHMVSCARNEGIKVLEAKRG